MSSRIALYSAVDEVLTHYEVDVAGAALARRKSVNTPANIQYAWPHPSRRYLYVATSNRGAGLKADFNHVSAYRIDPASGELAPHGEPQPLPHRAVHICVDAKGEYVLSAHNLPQAGITVNRINADGTLGPQITQAQNLDYGIYPHQVRIMQAFTNAAASAAAVCLEASIRPASPGRAAGPASDRAIRAVSQSRAPSTSH